MSRNWIRVGSIIFPDDVPVTKCATRSASLVHRDKHGIVRHVIPIAVSEHLYICRSSHGKMYSGIHPINAVAQLY